MIKYSDLTELQKRHIANGCGGKGSSIPVPDFRFKASCNHHDFYYWRGMMEKDRIAADVKFFELMLEDTLEYPFMLRWRYKAWAYAYYRAVRWFGKGYFSYRKGYKTMEDLEREMG